MNQLLITNKTLTLEKVEILKKMEQFKKLAQKVPALELQLKEQTEIATEREKKRLLLIREKSELEDKEYNLSNRLKNMETRFKTNSDQLTETIKENQELQVTLTKANNRSFLGTDGTENGESLQSLQTSQDIDLNQSI